MRHAPKDLSTNARYRRAILDRASKDADFRQECWIRASRDFVWFCDTFLWIYCPKDHPDKPHRPFILYDTRKIAPKS